MHCNEAIEVYKIGVKEKLWSNFLCRPSPEEYQLHNKSPKPLFILEAWNFPFVSTPIQRGINEILKEVQTYNEVGGLSESDNNWQREKAGLHASGKWFQQVLMVNGVINHDVCNKSWKNTCAIINNINGKKIFFVHKYIK